MYQLTDELPTRLATCGVYGIYCASNGRWYVGSSFVVWKRVGQHRSDLRSGRHHSVILQRTYEKYGEASFVVHLLETCNRKSLHSSETRWVEHLRARNPTCGMNIAAPDREDRTWATKTFRVRRGASAWTAVRNLVQFARDRSIAPCGLFNAAAARTATAFGYHVRRSDETEREWQRRRAKIQKGRNVEAGPKRGRVLRPQRFLVKLPSGISKEVESLYAFARETGLEKSGVYKALKTGTKSNGYYFRRISKHG